MTKPLQLDNEDQRIQALNDTGLLDTPTENLFDSITDALVKLFDMPLSLVCLVDKERVWFKSCSGLEGVSEIPRDIGFCPHTITQHEIFEVKDAAKDERFSDSPLVTAAPYFRYYAGAPLITSDGYALGTLCVMDYKARELSDSQKIQLTKLAETTTALIEARRQQNILQASKDFNLGAVVEMSPNETFLVDKITEKITYANRAALLNLGISLDRINDLRWNDVIIQSPQRLIDRYLNSTSSYFSSSLTFRSEHKRSDGSTYPVSCQIKSLDPRASEFLILSTDISKQIEAETRERALQNKIAHMGRINTANALSSGLAHELNQPLTAISQYCQAALSIVGECKSCSTLLHNTIENTASQANRADEIIKRYRSFTQKHQPSRVLIDIRILIEESTKLLNHTLNANNIMLTTNIGDNIPLINADRIQIQQVLLNLLTNSIEALNESEKENRLICYT